MRSRSLIVAVLAVWLTIGPAASAWAQLLEKTCETPTMAMSHDGCCGDEADQASCLGACLMAAPALPVATPQLLPNDPAQSPAVRVTLEQASVLAPPDVAPPKSLLS